LRFGQKSRVRNIFDQRIDGRDVPLRATTSSEHLLAPGTDEGCPVPWWFVGYLLQQRLGRGGMGVVDLALDGRGQPVALKRLALCGSAGEIDRARARVRREATALARLNHANIVPLLDVVDDGDDLVLVMPYLAGGTLSEQVRAYGPLRADQVLTIAGQLLEALSDAHRNGIVHRDIKPANVMFDLHGRPYLSDFGIASFRDATSGLTVTGSIIGTPDFMAPEQARGERTTPAADVFALGATLAFGATGQRPYGTGDSRVAINRAANGKVEPLPAELDPRLVRLLKPLLRPAPEKRPTAAEAASLARSMAGSSRPRRSGWVALVVLAMLTGVAVAALTGWAIGRGTETATPAGASPPASDAATTTAVPTSSAPTTLPCSDLPYQPCGQPAAPGTDGSRCTGERADFDGNRANGCEASPDSVDGEELKRSITNANLVPANDTDRYPFRVEDDFSFTCDGQVTITLTAPAGTMMKLELLDPSGRTLGARVAEPSRPARLALDEECATDDAGTYTAVVSYQGQGRSSAKYTLARTGSF